MNCSAAAMVVVVAVVVEAEEEDPAAAEEEEEEKEKEKEKEKEQLERMPVAQLVLVDFAHSGYFAKEPIVVALCRVPRGSD